MRLSVASFYHNMVDNDGGGADERIDWRLIMNEFLK